LCAVVAQSNIKQHLVLIHTPHVLINMWLILMVLCI